MFGWFNHQSSTKTCILLFPPRHEESYSFKKMTSFTTTTVSFMPLKLHREKKSAVLHHYKNDIRPLNGDLQEKSFMDKSVWSTFV